MRDSHARRSQVPRYHGADRARHPVFRRSVAELREWGMTVILDPARLPDAGEGPAVFPWELLRADLANLRAAVALQVRS
jgi:hypothetical protein